MRLSIVTVNTNEWHVLEKCLTSVFDETRNIEFETIVVDNASNDGSRDLIRLKFPQVKVISTASNLGFAAANNCGIRRARGKYVLLLNPDTEIHGGAINRCLEYMDQRTSVGLLGCKLILPGGKIQESVRSFPTVWNVFCESTFLYLLFPKNEWIAKYHMTFFDYESNRVVDWVCGAFLLIRREVIEKIGLLDEQFYMYTEEVDYCYRAKRAGYLTCFFPTASVYHFWGGMNAANLRVILWTSGSQILFFKKHFDGFERLALIALKFGGIALRVFVYFIGGLVLRKASLLQKSKYAAVTFFRLLTGEWSYVRGYTGPVSPWKA